MISTIILCLIILYFFRRVFTGVETSKVDLGQEETIVHQDYTPETLARFNGADDPKIFMAVKGKVFDVTSGSMFYGPGGPYENFAGRDASRGLALNSFDVSCLTPVDEPLDTLSDLSKEEIESLDNWEEHFENKYKVVGSLRNPEKK